MEGSRGNEDLSITTTSTSHKSSTAYQLVGVITAFETHTHTRILLESFSLKSSLQIIFLCIATTALLFLRRFF